MASQHKGSNALSVRSSVMYEERIRSGHWLRLVILCFCQCFDTSGWVAFIHSLLWAQPTLNLSAETI